MSGNATMPEKAVISESSDAVWLDGPLALDTMADERFRDIFRGCARIAVNRHDHRAYAAAKDIAALMACLDDHSVERAEFYIVPGPSELVMR